MTLHDHLWKAAEFVICVFIGIGAAAVLLILFGGR